MPINLKIDLVIFLRKLEKNFKHEKVKKQTIYHLQKFSKQTGYLSYKTKKVRPHNQHAYQT